MGQWQGRASAAQGCKANGAHLRAGHLVFLFDAVCLLHQRCISALEVSCARCRELKSAGNILLLE